MMDTSAQNPANAFMDEAQEQMATFAALISAAQTILTQSQQAFERANETSTTANCPTRLQLAAEPRKQYSALLQLAYAIARTLKEPILQKQLAGTLTFIGKPSSRAIALKKAS